MEILRRVSDVLEAVGDIEGEESRKVLEQAEVRLRIFLTSERDYSRYLDGLSERDEKFLTKPVEGLGGKTSWLAVLRKAIEEEENRAELPKIRKVRKRTTLLN